MRKSWAVLLVSALLVAGGVVYGQNELPVAEGFVFKWGNENIFPSGVRFFITLSRPADDLEEVTLTIETGDQEPFTQEIDLASPVASGPSFTDLDYVWIFPDDSTLRLFSDEDAVFEWRARDAIGQTARVRDRLLFKDDRVEWVRSEDPSRHIHLTVSASGPSPDQIRQSTLHSYDLMSANTGAAPEFDILLYPPDVNPTGCEQVQDAETGEAMLAARGPVSGITLPCDPDRSRRLFEISGLDVLQSDGTTIAGAQSALVRFLTRQFYGTVWGEADVPDWFLSGLTQFYQPASKAHQLLPVQNAARTDRLLPLREMAVERPDDSLWQAQSYAMVLYIAGHAGVNGLFDLATDLANATSFQAAYEAKMGQMLDALLPNLRRWVFSSTAASAFDYTPYQPETPTPVPSRTRTPFPPTATRTATATATITLTPSVTGVLSPTPTDTPTITRTATPLPPTVTPRPPGSLFTPTPVPAAGLLDDPTTRLGVIVVLLILLAIVGLAYLIVIRRHD